MTGVPPRHAHKQIPSKQRSQPWPHFPQFLLSDRRFTQALAQSDRPALHSNTHWPLSQLAVPPAAAHAFPHAPQLATSFRRSTQAALYVVWPAHCFVQMPDTHAALAGHFFPHAPQSSGLDVRLMQLPPQFESGALHVMPHFAAAQVAAPPGAPGHTVLHLPQWLGSESSAKQAFPHGE